MLKGGSATQAWEHGAGGDQGAEGAEVKLGSPWGKDTGLLVTTGYRKGGLGLGVAPT